MATEVAVRPRETLSVEQNGINVISDAERKGRPRDLFWPWCAANIAVLGISYGSFLLGFGVSFWQATVAGLIGTILSFLLVGFVSLAGKRGSAPTMVLSRAAYGVHGGRIPAALSYILLVGWETVLVSLATLATATVFDRLGWGGGDATKIIAFLLVAGVVVFSGIFGFNVIMRLQAFLTVALAILTVGYVVLTVGHINWGTVTSIPNGSPQAVLGALIFAATGFGLGWVNGGGDRRRDHDSRHHLRGVVREQLHRSIRRLSDHPRCADLCVVWCLPRRPPPAKARLLGGRPLRPARPVRTNQLGRGGHDAGRDLPGLGPRHEWFRRVAQLAGLSAQSVWPRTKRRWPLDLRQPRRAGGAGRGIRRPVLAGAFAGAQTGNVGR